MQQLASVALYHPSCATAFMFNSLFASFHTFRMFLRSDSFICNYVKSKALQYYLAYKPHSE